ncbi:hypothetical protein GQX73_g5704 [Xylaria multiplex]|uniref:Cytochrome P450 n=1 Tax=Xylaria multiplex TaxID=323545 RepID=A0A7C8MRT9_9PEZI|nr:hypothetical protein GQX73_g5704 [Xylaria multiplex]
MHRVSQICGDDVEEFRPERWLDCEDPGTLRRFFFAFGGGTRTCIGRSKPYARPVQVAIAYLMNEKDMLKDISWLEIEKIVPTLVMRYNFKLADGSRLTEECGVLVLLKGLRVQVTRLAD